MMQYVVVGVIVACAVGYAARRLSQTLNKKQSCCCDCEGCALKNQHCDKKTCEKFGQSK